MSSFKSPVASGAAIGYTWVSGGFIRTIDFRPISPRFMWVETGSLIHISGTSSVSALASNNKVDMSKHNVWTYLDFCDNEHYFELGIDVDD